MGEESRRAFGADRLDAGAGGEIWLVCPVPKSWAPRQDKTLTRAEYPGTAVSWQGGVFEVLRAEPLTDGSIRYRLAAWEEGHAIRRMEQYDDASQAARETESGDRRDRVRHRRLSILLAPLAGLLPGAKQKDMESEFGAPALAMTISSALPLFVIGFLGLFRNLIGGLGGGLGLPGYLAPPFPVALYLFGESALRLASAFAMGEPMGSLPVVIAYEAWKEARAPGPEPHADPSAAAQSRGDLALERSLHDRYTMLEPLLSLLPPSDQRVLNARFGFDPIRWGRLTMGVLILVGGANALIALMNFGVGAGGFIDGFWLLAGGFLCVEQLRRRKLLKAGQPAASVLGALVRPLAKPLLAPPSIVLRGPA
ncbi:MAG: hypothetical protein ABI968_14945 [Acidobacteriota bacterium]